ncbi:MAG: glucokinase [Polyangiaceae bacterium]
MILVGDIGGTNTRLAIYSGSPGRSAAPLAQSVQPSREHARFEDIARAFLGSWQGARPTVAVLGVAGPVREGTAKVTNLPWKLEERALQKALGIRRVSLHNDLVVGARGCLAAPATSLEPLTRKRPDPHGQHLAVIAAGTGLGEARLIWDGSRHLALGTEGGHCDFAPQTPLEIEIWHFLSARFGNHVSYERVVSGAGLGALYDFFASRGGREPSRVTRRLAQGDRNEGIAELGLARASRATARAVDLFVTIYGAEAGNMVLRELALGGVFVSGNIARKLVLPRSELFLEGFRRKGRFSELLTEVPVAVVTDPLIGVLGALQIARERRGEAKGTARRPRAVRTG